MRLRKQFAKIIAMLMVFSLVPLSGFAQGEPKQQQEDVKPIHTLTINYFFEEGESSEVSGKIASQPYVASLAEGATYSQSSPSISGYSASQPVVSGQMGTADIVVNVLYTPADGVKYTVTHHFAELRGGYKDEVQNLTGKTGAKTNASAYNRTGFTARGFEQTTVAADGSTNIDIYYDRNVHYVYFHTNGGSYVDPVEAVYGQQVTVDNKSTQQEGFTFLGWYKNEALTQKAESSLTMGDQNVNLYAKWNKGNANYTAVFWQEKADEPGAYDYAFQTRGSAKTDSQLTLNADSAERLWNDSQKKSMNGFQFARSTTETVRGDGTTILNVYYTRKTVSISFELKDWHGRWYTAVTLTGRYGEKVGNRWPSEVKGTAYGWYNSPDGGTGRYYVSLEEFPSGDLTLYGYSQSGSRHKIYYCMEMLEGSGGQADITTPNGKRYQYRTGSPIQFVGSSWVSISQKEDCYPIAGFEYDWYANFGWSNDEDAYVAYIYYSRAEYKIDFNSMGGSTAPSQIKAKYGQRISAPTRTVTKPGYVFAGWYDNEACQGAAYQFTTMPDHNLVLYAKWEKQQYTVSFDENYKGAPVTQQSGIGYLDPVSQPADPTREGYDFAGWYTNAEGQGSRYNFDRPVASSFTLYAKWTPQTSASYTVKYLKEDGNEAFPSKHVDNVKVESTVTEVAVIDNSVKLVPDAVSKSTVIQPGENEIVFTYKPFVYLAYKVQYLDKETGQPVAQEKVISNCEKAKVTENYVHVPGYVPDAYQKSQVLSLEETPAAIQNNVITFTYTKNALASYKVEHYVQNAAETMGYDRVYASEAIQAAAGTPVSADLTKTYEGHTLNTTRGTLSGAVNSDNTLVLRLYYDWNYYGVTYNANGGSGSMTDPATYRHGTAASAKDNAFTAPQHMYFTGWNTKADGQGTAYAAGDSIPMTGPVVLYAMWANEQPVDIIYHVNFSGATEADYTDPNGPYYLSDLESAPVSALANMFTSAPQNMKFVGWNTEANGSGKSYSPNSTIAVTGETHLYAQWILKNQYNIVYYGNGGSTDAGQSELNSAAVYEGNDLAVADNTFVNPGYSFAGWNTSPTGDGTVYAVNQNVSMNSTLQLYAQWTYDASQHAQLYYNGNGSDDDTKAPVDNTDYLKGAVVNVQGKGELARTEATFLGWSTTQHALITTQAEEDAVVFAGATMQLNETTTLYAVWAIDEKGPEGGPDDKPDYKQYGVTYDANGGQGLVPVDGNLYDLNNTVTVLGNESATPLTRENATFLGWSTTQHDLITTKEQAGAIASELYTKGSTFAIQGNQQLYAVWALDANGPDKEPDGVPDYDEYTVSYHGNADGVTGAVVDDALYPSGFSVTVKDNAFVRTDYMFITWNTQAEGTGIAAPAGSVFTIEANADLYAQWKLDANGPGGGPDEIPDEEEHSISYDANYDGWQNLTSVPVNPNLYPDNYETAVNVQFDPIPQREGYTFLGWDMDKTAIDPQYPVGTAQSLMMGTENVTLYAVWGIADITVASYNDTYDGGTHGVTVMNTKPGDAVSYSVDGVNFDENLNTFTNVTDTMVYVRVERAGFGPFEANARVTITPAPLTITAEDKNVTQGDAVPAYTLTAEGFVNGESLADLMGQAAFSSTYTPDSVPGTYPIEVSGLVSQNYEISFVPGTVTVSAAVIPPAPVVPTTPPTTPTTPATTTTTTTPGGTTTIDENQTPLDDGQGDTAANVNIDENQVPQAQGARWALLNLLLAIGCALAMVGLWIGYFVGKKKQQEENEPEDSIKRKGLWRLLSALPGLGSIIVFLLTENMKNPMVFTDHWTLLMAIIAVVQVAVIVMATKKHEQDDSNDAAKNAGDPATVNA